MFGCIYNFIKLFLFISLLFFTISGNCSKLQGDKTIFESLQQNLTLSTPIECSRTCREGDPPKICYYKFTVEYYTVLGRACSQCTPNSTNSLRSTCQCVLADGVQRGFLSVNRMLPGPSIEICEGDEVIVDVKNKVSGTGLTIHWHGLLHIGTQYYDGVPFVTQCPIHAGNTFRYRFNGDEAGTYFWHSHTGLQRLDGVSGTLIIRQPRNKDPHRHLYDHDLRTHTIFLTDFLHEYASEVFPEPLNGSDGQMPKNVLINGRGQYTDPVTGSKTKVPLAEFTVSQGYRYRFRMINSFGTMCLAALTVQNHSLVVITSDAKPLRPVDADTIITSTGERYDFIINANQSIGSYWIQVRLIDSCGPQKIIQLAKLRYESASGETMSPNPTYDSPLPNGVVLNIGDGKCDEVRKDAICVNQLRRLDHDQQSVSAGTPDVKFYLSFGFHFYKEEEIFKPNTYQTFSANSQSILVAKIDKISYASAPFPLISQINDNSPEVFCNGSSKPDNCLEMCTCTHILDVPLNSNVEIIVFDTADIPLLKHPFHLHGYVFSVIGEGRSTGKKLTLDSIKEMDKENLLNRNFEQPPLKDTIIVPQNGYAIIRFNASNPGYWFFHCHINFHVIEGMAMVIHVGTQEDLPPIPAGFPKCGDFLPPL